MEIAARAALGLCFFLILYCSFFLNHAFASEFGSAFSVIVNLNPDQPIGRKASNLLCATPQRLYASDGILDLSLDHVAMAVRTALTVAPDLRDEIQHIELIHVDAHLCFSTNGFAAMGVARRKPPKGEVEVSLEWTFRDSGRSPLRTDGIARQSGQRDRPADELLRLAIADAVAAYVKQVAAPVN